MLHVARETDGNCWCKSACNTLRGITIHSYNALVLGVVSRFYKSISPLRNIHELEVV